MAKQLPEKDNKRKVWNKPSLEKLTLKNTESGAYEERYERAKTNTYGGS